MITNLFVDASVLAFPRESENQQEDCENIKKFLRNMHKLSLLWENIPNITISIQEGIVTSLSKRGYFFDPDNNEQRIRLNVVYRKYPDFDIDRQNIAKFLLEKLFNEYNSIHFDNRYNKQDINKNALQNFVESASVCNEKYFLDEHKKLISYIHLFNKRYKVNDYCFIAISGRGQDYQEDSVNITRIRKIYDRYKQPEPNFKTLKEAYENAKKETTGYLHFSEDIEKEDNKDISIIMKDNFNFYQIPNKIYHYLTTLASFVKNATEDIDENAVNELVKRFGCNSSSESGNNYQNCPHRRWYDGKDNSQFILHLKPTTAPYNNKLTTRIYYKYDKQEKPRIVVGMILEHPQNCPCKDERRCSEMAPIEALISR
ncbi:hypothetical protein AGMMS50212_05490 [Spirochaetia bacterium]|nr:hypothetical protein AGMMS50212_05490 [Spirochaetia bacterium]